MNTHESNRKEQPEKPGQSIQDGFLNVARREKTPVTIHLMSGIKLNGRIRSFDKFSLILESNHREQLIFKHAISTVMLERQAPSPSEARTEEG